MPSEFEKENPEIVSYLQDQGFSPDEVVKIVAKLQSYDDQMRHGSIFDSLEDGSFSLDKIIKEALE